MVIDVVYFMYIQCQFQHMEKLKMISIRLYETDTQLLKTLAGEIGIPYQTYIRKVLRKHPTKQLKLIRRRYRTKWSDRKINLE